MANLHNVTIEIQNIILRLSPDEQVNVFNKAIFSTSSEVQFRIKSFLRYTPSPDLFILLPPELQHSILLKVDSKSLLSSCQVSKEWNRIIKHDDNLWKEKCSLLGVNIDAKPHSVSWYCAFILSMRQRYLICSQKMFYNKEINLQNVCSEVWLMGYKEGYFLSISDVSNYKNCVNIWKLEYNIPILTFSIEPTVECFSFLPNNTLLCGHFNGTLSSWDISTHVEHKFPFEIDSDDFDEFTRLKMKFLTHTSPVDECDFSEEMNLMISGSLNGDVKLWCLTSGDQLYGISHSSTIKEVFLLPFYNDTNHAFFTAHEAGIKKYIWPSKSNEYSKDCRSKPLKLDCEELDCIKENLGIVNQVEFKPILSCVLFRYIDKNGLPSDIYESINFCVFDTKSLKTMYIIDKYCASTILGMGSSFTIVVNYRNQVFIVQTKTGNKIGEIKAPCSSASRFLLGEKQWLDGLKGWEICNALNDDEGLLAKNFIEKYITPTSENMSVENSDGSTAVFENSKKFCPVLFFVDHYNHDGFHALCWNEEPGRTKKKVE